MKSSMGLVASGLVAATSLVLLAACTADPGDRGNPGKNAAGAPSTLPTVPEGPETLEEAEGVWRKFDPALRKKLCDDYTFAEDVGGDGGIELATQLVALGKTDDQAFFLASAAESDCA